MKLSHLPTFMLIIGYPFFWFEMYFVKNHRGITTPLAWIAFALISLILALQERKSIFNAWLIARSQFGSCQTGVKIFTLATSFIILAILTVALYASLTPPYLQQEFDALNYHLTLPRQHLILGSFKHIPWSSADLMPLPIQFALAPYWFVTELPNKLPQFFFLMGLGVVSVNLGQSLGGIRLLNWVLVVAAISGSHGFGIQMGTAMLDIVVCYLFIACLDSFLRKSYALTLLEFTFWFWSKSFIPFQAAFLALGLFLIYFLCMRFGRIRKVRLGFDDALEKSLKWPKVQKIKKLGLGFLLLSVFIGGPFLVKSSYYSGTPLFPFLPGLVKIHPGISQASKTWQSLLMSSQTHLSTKDQYGHGRSFIDFLRHFWLLAVPEKGVNNAFDYPLGLPYLLFLGPFFLFTVSAIQKKIFPILPMLTLIYWASWWMGSQQARFFYLPLILVFITVSAIWNKPSFILSAALLISLGLNSFSVFRAHRNEIGAPPTKILRSKDLALVEMSKKYRREGRLDAIPLEYYDVAYAQFPVTVIREKMPYVLYLEEKEDPWPL